MMQIRDHLAQLRTTRRGRRIVRVARIVFTVGILLFLVWQLREVDFREVFLGLPRTPWFYVLLISLYLMLPAVQFLAYRTVWDFGTLSAIRAFIKKRILNKDVLGYSGEVYILAWAQDHVKRSSQPLLECVRDMNIISAAASNLMAVLLLAFFVLMGQVSVQDLIGDRQAYALVGAAGITLILLFVMMSKRRRWLFSMAWKATWVVFGLHLGRVLLHHGLEISMWHLAMPDVPIQIWFTYAAISVVVTRIPFLPNPDLLTLAIAVGIAGAMTVSEAQITALFGAVVLVNRLITLLFFATLSIRVPDQAESISVAKSPLDASTKPASI